MSVAKTKIKKTRVSKDSKSKRTVAKSKIEVVDQTDKQREFLFSVIIPVYNCAQYLPEAIDSVVDQTIGFDKIQVILVNDGSPDNSDEVCREYQAKYPENIIYLKQPNAGVSVSRNRGIEHSTGVYVNFLDSDDKWQPDAFAKANRMFNKHPEIDVIGVRIHCFEATDVYHPLDFKFDRDKVIDIFNEYNHIQLSSAAAFFRRSVLNGIRFDTSVRFSEDAKLVTSVLLDNPKMGILASTEYMYRKRATNDSAVQSKEADVDWYSETPEKCYMWAINESIKKYGFVLQYVQYYIMYDYQWRVRTRIPSNIPSSVVSAYLKITKDILSYIDDEIILDQRKLYSEYKIELLRLKYGYDIMKDAKYRKHVLYFHGYRLVNLRGRSLLTLNTLNIDKEHIVIRGMLNTSLPGDDFKLYAVINGEDHLISPVNVDTYTRYFFNEPFISNQGIEIKVNRDNFMCLYFKLVYRDYFVTNLLFSDGPQFGIGTGKRLYYKKYGKLYYCKKNRIVSIDSTPRHMLGAIRRTDIWLRKNRKNSYRRLRLCYYVLKWVLNKSGKTIWLLSDRPNVANDNGSVLFEYLCKGNLPKNVVPVFAVNKTSSDYKRMKRLGRVVGFGTRLHKLAFLLAEKNISSTADDWTTNLFGRGASYIKDKYASDFIFLQHGVTKDDLSSWLNVYAKDIDGFVCATHDEAKSLVNPKYGYSKPTIWMTGLPRYDKLSSKPNNEVLVMPTWRRGLASPLDPKTDTRPYSNKVANSAFCKFYSSLINDGRILKVLQECGYQLKLVLHPSMGANVSDFTSDSVNVSVSTNANYSELFKEGNLMVTDYSSVAFDFAYLKKPVIYAQFDKEDFFAEQIYNPGYFSYEKDGFGPVCYDYESTVKAICDAIKGGCKMPKKYQDRVDRTFAYHDHDNCKRVLDKILAMK